MIDVTVKVPEERVAEFYSMFGLWLAGGGAQGASGWQPNDHDLARRFWEKISPPARALFNVLIDDPEVKFTAEELAKVCTDKGKYGVAGVIAWPGKHASALGRPLPCETEAGSADGGLYWMKTATATLFRTVRTEAGSTQVSGAIDWHARAALVWPRLVELAAAKQSTTYGEMGARTGIFHRNLRLALDPIGRWCHENGHPPLTILVVDAARGRPGDGIVGTTPETLEADRARVFAFDWSTLKNPFST